MRREPRLSSRTEWDFRRNRLTRAVEARRLSGLPILDLTESNPTRCALTHEGSGVLEMLSRPEALLYEPDPRGRVEARRAVEALYAERGAHVAADRIVLTASTSEAYSWLFRLLCDPGDEVLAPVPSYPLFDHLARVSDVALATYPLAEEEGYRIDLEALEAALTDRSRAVLVVSPGNPTGARLREEERESLVDLCAARGLALVCDEVFGDFSFRGSPAWSPQRPADQSAHPREGGCSSTSIARESPQADPTGGTHEDRPADPIAVQPGPRAEARATSTEAAGRVRTLAGEDRVLTFVLDGISKMLALPQLKLGWIAASGPESSLDEALARLEMIGDTFLSVGSPVQAALPGLLSLRPAIQARILSRLRANLGALGAALPAGHPARALPVEAGWSAVVRVPATRSDEEWSVALLEEEGVLVHPGFLFDFPVEGRLVISLLPEERIFREGIERMARRLLSA